MNPIASVIQLISEGLDSRAPRSSGPLTLVPLLGGLMAKEYLVGSDAFSDGLLSVKEVDHHGDVTHLEARNDSSLPVLLIDGEHLEGAKQNRILNATVLLGPKRATTLPVACVEQGRWSYEGNLDFSPSVDIAYGDLRSKNAVSRSAKVRASGSREVDQSEVWDEVEHMHARLGSSSLTGAMKDGFDHRRVEVDAIKEPFLQPEPGQTGVIACIGGRPVALDAFDRPETLLKFWPRLLSGYALDAVGRPAAELEESAVAAFLAQAGQADATCHEGLGLGMDVVLTSPHLVGNALAWEDGVVHLALFSRSQDPPTRREEELGIQAPSGRARTHGTSRWSDSPPRWNR